MIEPLQALEMVLLYSELFRKEFSRWLTAHWKVFRTFEHLAVKGTQPGDVGKSARAIAEQMRDASVHIPVNGNYVPDMAQLFMLLHPEFDGLFALRKRKAA